MDIENCYINCRAKILYNNQYDSIEGFDDVYREYLKQIGIRNTDDFKLALSMIPMLLTTFYFDVANKKIIPMYKLRENLYKEDIVRLLNESSLNADEKYEFEEILDFYLGKTQEIYNFNFDTFSKIEELKYIDLHKCRHVFVEYVFDSAFEYVELFKPMFNSINMAVKYRALNKNAKAFAMLEDGMLINADDDGEYCISIDLDFREIIYDL